MRAVRRMAYLSIMTSLATIVLKFGAYFLQAGGEPHAHLFGFNDARP